MFINIIQKKPKAAKTPIHLHQSLVDETKHKTVSIWIPMDDALKETNTLGFIPGSHKIAENFRPKYVNKIKNIAKYIEKRYIQLVDVYKTEALVLSDRTLHYSPKNESDQTRTALMVVLKPKKADLELGFYENAVVRKYYIPTSEIETNLNDPSEPDMSPINTIAYDTDVQYSKSEFTQKLKQHNPQIDYSYSSPRFLRWIKKLSIASSRRLHNNHYWHPTNF